jgi:hypothetical protein
LRLDPATVQLKKAADGSRAKPSAEVAQASSADLVAYSLFFMRQHPEYYVCELNGNNLMNWLLAAEENGRPLNVEAFDRGYAWLSVNGYIESKPALSRKRGDAAQVPAKIYPPFVSAQERAQRELNRALTAQEKDDAEREAARRMPFEQLRKKVIADNPEYGKRQETYEETVGQI